MLRGICVHDRVYPWTLFLSCIPNWEYKILCTAFQSQVTYALATSPSSWQPPSLWCGNVCMGRIDRQAREGRLSCGRRKGASWRKQSPVGLGLPSGWIWSQDVSKKACFSQFLLAPLLRYLSCKSQQNPGSLNLSLPILPVGWLILSGFFSTYKTFTCRLMEPAFIFDWAFRSTLRILSILESKMAIKRLPVYTTVKILQSSLQQTKWCSIKAETTDKICLRAYHSLLCSMLISHKASTGKWRVKVTLFFIWIKRRFLSLERKSVTRLELNFHKKNAKRMRVSRSNSANS